MVRVYNDAKIKSEILPNKDGSFDVIEHLAYKVDTQVCFGNEVKVYIEDYAVNDRDISLSDGCLIIRGRIFEDYFGFAQLRVGSKSI